LKGMTVQTSAFMTFGDIWQAVSSFNTKLFINLHYFQLKLDQIGAVY